MIDQNAVRGTEPPPTVEVIPPPVVRIDLGCGQNKREGFLGFDKYEAPGVDIVHDLLSYPWPIQDASVDELHASHFVEHIDGPDRLRFFQEAHRVLKPGGTFLCITPAADSNRFMQDPTHKFPPIVPEFYQCYLNKEWREANKLTHGAYAGDFHFVTTAINVSLDPSMNGRNDEYRSHAMRHFRNATSDLYVTLTKA